MPGTEATLFNAFAQADAAGLGGSPLDRALAVFGGNDPQQSPLPQQQSPLDMFLGVGPSMQGAPVPQPQQPMFQQPAAPNMFQEILDKAGQIAAPVFQGSSFLDLLLPGNPGTELKEDIASVPFIGETGAEIADNILSPATFLVAARGMQIANSLRAVPVVNKLSSAFLKPILETSGFMAKLGVESAAIAGGSIANQIAEDAPFPVQMAAALTGAILGARTGIKVFGDVNQAGTAVRAVTNQLHPTDTIVELNRLTGALDDVDAARLSGMDEEARRLRGATVDTAGSNHRYSYEMPNDITETADNLFKAITTQQITDAEQLPTLMVNRIGSIKPVESLLGMRVGSGTFLEHVGRLFDGNLNRNANGRAIANVAHNYASQGVLHAGNLEVLLKEDLDMRVFKPKLENVVLRTNLNLDEVDARRVFALEKNRNELDESFETLRKQMSTLAKNKHSGLSGLEEYGIVDSANADLMNMARKMQNIKRQKIQLDGEIERLRGGKYGSFDEANKALQDVTKLFDQFRTGAIAAAPDQEIRHSMLVSLIAENQGLFDLTVEQKEFFDQLAEFNDFNLALDNAFKLDVDPIDGYYVQHVADWYKMGADGKMTIAKPDEVANQFAKATLNSKKKFQFPRTFENTLDWMRALDSSRNPAQWNARMDKAIEAARAKLDLDEVSRLEGLKASELIPMPRTQHFATNVASRMAESYAARAQSLAKSVADEFGPEVRKEVDELLVNNTTSDLIKVPAQAAGFLRSLLLRADLSMVGVQGTSGVAMLSGPNSGMREFANTVRSTIGSDEQFSKWMLNNSDRLSFWTMHDLVLAPADINIINGGLDDDLATHLLSGGKGSKKTILDSAGKPVKLGGVEQTTVGQDRTPIGNAIKQLDKIQFARGIGMMKIYAAEHMLSVLKTARTNDSFADLAAQGFPFLSGQKKNLAKMSDDDAARLVGDFVNDIFGGRNRVALGRTQTQNLLESLFMLTPGFTRGTLNVALKSFKPGVEGALARDYALRSMIIAGGVVTLLTAATNGIEFKDGKPSFTTPNLFDPSADDWFDIPLPGGRSIRPMSRFRGLARIVAGSIQEAAINGNWEKATQYWTDDALRWFSYRQSALMSTIGGDPIGDIAGEQRGNSFARNTGLKDLLFNPSENRALDLREHFFANWAPVAVGGAADSVINSFENQSVTPAHWRDLGIALGGEFLGVGTFGPSMLQSQVANRTAEMAVELGLDPELAESMARNGQSAIYARNDSGQYILTSDQRSLLTDAIAEEFEISRDLAAAGGRRSDRERASTVEAIRSAQVGTFMDANEATTDEYTRRVAMLDSAFSNQMISPMQYSEEITKLRIWRAGSRWGAEKSSPAALLFLDSDARKGSQNAKDAMFAAISAEAFGSDFLDPDTGTYDFEAQEAVMSSLQDKYGDLFYEWQNHRDRNKSTIEVQRDAAYRQLSDYFSVADEVWLMVTQGQMGRSEREFDRMLDQQLTAANVPPEYLSVARSAMKQQMGFMSQYRNTTELMRQAIRATNPAVDQAAMQWLGVKPIGYQS